MTELERKITLDFVHGYGKQTVAEYIERREFADAVQSIPEISPEIPAVDSGYVGKHEQNVSVFDAIHAELLGEKEIRAEKFRKTHDLCKKSLDKTPADRKRDKKVRMRKLYGLSAFEDTNHGKTVFYWDVKGGQKKFPEYEAEILRNMKIAESDRIMRDDYEDEQRQAYWDAIGYVPERVGKTTLTKQMDRAYRRMQKIANDFCEKNGYQWGERYAYDPMNHYYHVDYPDEYYRVRNEYMELEAECDRRFKRKLDKGNKYLRKYVCEEE